jgi:hypothetical protein
MPSFHRPYSESRLRHEHCSVAGCTSGITINTLKTWTSLAQSALLAGKQIKVGLFDDPLLGQGAVDRFDGESYRPRLKPRIDKDGPPPAAPVTKPKPPLRRRKRARALPALCSRLET